LAGKIATALTAAEDSVQQFWNALKIPDAKLAALIEGLLGVIISTLSGFAAALPAPAAPPARAQRAKRIATPAQRRSVKQFKQDFNGVLARSGYEKYALQ
jgi:hypothetical protein